MTSPTAAARRPLIERLGVFGNSLSLSFRADRRGSVALLVVMTVNAVGTSVIGLALNRLVDAVTQRNLTGVIIAVILGAISQTLLEVGFRLQFSLRLELTERVNVLVQEEIALTAASLSTLEHLEDPVYLDRITTLRQDSTWLADCCWSLVDTVSIIVQICFAVSLLALLSPPLTGLLILALPPVWFTRQAQRVAQKATDAAAEKARLSSHLLDTCTRASSAKEVCVTSASPALRTIATEAWNDSTSVRVRGEFYSALLNLCGFLIFTAGFLAALAYAVEDALNGHGSAGGVILVITLAGRLQGQVGHGVWLIGKLMKSVLVADRYLWLRDLRSAGTDKGHPAPKRIERGIRLRDVDFRYPGTTEYVLKQVNLELPAGSVVAVVGENGAGKSTLVKLLGKFYEPTSGSVLVDDQKLASIDTLQWRASLSAAFQDHTRFEFQVRESVGIGDLSRIDDEDAVLRALRGAGALSLVSKLEQGIGTRLGRTFGGIDLSLGQWQRLALARATMRTTPLLLILDEPTASLDARTEQAQYEHFAALARESGKRTGAITLLVSHRFSTVQMADLIVVVNDHGISETGTHAELLAAGGLYSEMFRSQARAYA
ncbi:ABC transporter ATP-binding protein/permease (plasmid) [Streptomyces viridifaciens]|nr:ABC transporter ATP-binding protein/permease [Streptomyces viridifaciens]